MKLRKNLILRRPQSGRLEGRTCVYFGRQLVLLRLLVGSVPQLRGQWSAGANR